MIYNNYNNNITNMNYNYSIISLDVWKRAQLTVGLGERLASGDAFAMSGQADPAALLGLREGHLPPDAAQPEEGRRRGVGEEQLQS